MEFKVATITSCNNLIQSKLASEICTLGKIALFSLTPNETPVTDMCI